MSIPVQRVREKTTTILNVPLTSSLGAGLEAGGLTTLTASMVSLDTGLPIAGFTGRDVKPSLSGGVLALELTPADLTMVTTRAIESRVVVLSAIYGSGKQWHEEIPLEVQNLASVA